MNLKDKVIYVTGASLGIGYEIASELLKQDAKVVITARNKENLDKAKNALSKISNNVQAHAFDISDENELKKSMNNVYDHFGKIDGLVNNAPSIHPGMIKDMSLSQWKTNFKANLEGAFLTTNYVLPKMMEQKSGSIVNISSVAGTKGISFISAYAAAKSALINFSKSCAIEAAPNVRVNCVIPGAIETPSFSAAMMTDEMLESTKNTIPLKRIGKPIEVANAVMFLLSDLASYITGADLIIDGGKTADLNAGN